MYIYYRDYNIPLPCSNISSVLHFHIYCMCVSHRYLRMGVDCSLLFVLSPSSRGCICFLLWWVYRYLLLFAIGLILIVGDLRDLGCLSICCCIRHLLWRFLGLSLHCRCNFPWGLPPVPPDTTVVDVLCT